MHGPIGPTIKREVQRPSTVITACSKQNEYSIKDSHDTLKYSKNMRDRYHLHIILISKLYLSWCIADSKASPHASPIFRRLASRTFSIIQRLFQRSAYLALASSGAQPLSSFSSWSLAWQKNYALPIDKRYMSTSGPLSLMRTLKLPTTEFLPPRPLLQPEPLHQVQVDHLWLGWQTVEWSQETDISL